MTTNTSPHSAPPGQGEAPDPPDLGTLLLNAVSSPTRASVAAAASALTDSFRAAGSSAVLSGSHLSGVVLDATDRLAPRDHLTLLAAHPGLSEEEVACLLVDSAARTSLAIGAAAGAAASAAQLAPPAWLTLPLGPVVTTVLTTLLELRLVAELHSVYRVELPSGARDRSKVLVGSWLSGRSARRPRDVGSWLKVGRDALTSNLKRRLLLRLAQSVSTLAPLLVGAAIGGALARRSTRELGNSIASDLASGKGKTHA